MDTAHQREAAPDLAEQLATIQAALIAHGEILERHSQILAALGKALAEHDTQAQHIAIQVGLLARDHQRINELLAPVMERWRLS